MYIVRCAQLRATLATPLYMVGGKERECRSGDSLCSRNARSQTPLARANGTSRRVSGWAGEKVARTVGTSPGRRINTGKKGGI